MMIPPEDESLEDWMKANPDQAAAIDDITGEALDARMVQKARQDEIDYFLSAPRV